MKRLFTFSITMRYLLVFCCAALSAIGSYAQDSLAINAFSMGGGSREFGQLATRISDTRTVLFNITSNCNTATCNHGMAAIMIDNNGHLLWYKKIGASVIDVDPSKAIYTSDGHILMVGYYGTPKRLLIKMDTLFNVLWTTVIEQKPSNTFTGPFIEDLVEVNHCYYMVFSNEISKVREDGSVVFSKYFGPSVGNTSQYTYVNYNSITQVSASEFFVGGALRDTASVYAGTFTCIVDTNGVMLRQKKFGIGAPYGSDVTYSFRQSANDIRIFGHYNNDLYTAEVDTNLTVSNLKKYSGTILYTHDICYNGADRYFVSAYEFGTAKISVFALDNSGTVQWSKFLNNGQGYFRSSNHMINDCSFGIYSSTPIGTSLAHKGYWAKLNSDGTSGSAAAESALTLTTLATLPLAYSATTVTDSGQWQTSFPTETFISDATPVTDSAWFSLENPTSCTSLPTAVMQQSATLFPALLSPNPFSGALHIGDEWQLAGISRVVVYDVTGRVITTEAYPVSRTLNIPADVKGIVFVRWVYNGRSYTQKLLAL